MKQKNSAGLLAVGVLAGMVIGTPTAQAVSEYLMALPTASTIYVDGEKVDWEAYTINGANYVKLRDIGQTVGFNVYWDGMVRIDTDSPYTGEAPGHTVTLPTDGSRYVPQTGDVIPCDDGTEYTITDVSRWDNNLFASGPVGDLPPPPATGAASRRWNCPGLKHGDTSWTAAITCSSEMCMSAAGCSTPL